MTLDDLFSDTPQANKPTPPNHILKALYKGLVYLAQHMDGDEGKTVRDNETYIKTLSVD